MLLLKRIYECNSKTFQKFYDIYIYGLFISFSLSMNGNQMNHAVIEKEIIILRMNVIMIVGV